ncbi:MAG TPA: hypothetical protein PLR25_22920, partial [Planctomycetaceae bacterium]|nr:hypothetical protein [Planctomycetaceae bacterium]
PRWRFGLISGQFAQLQKALARDIWRKTLVILSLTNVSGCENRLNRQPVKPVGDHEIRKRKVANGYEKKIWSLVLFGLFSRPQDFPAVWRCLAGLTGILNGN